MLTPSQPHQVTAVRVAIDVGLFNVLASSNGQFLSLKDLALGTHVEEALLSKYAIFSIRCTLLIALVRWVRVLVGMGLLMQSEDGKYGATKTGLAFSKDAPYADAAIFL
jgi:hypothetical protein